jgi:hypothetical protein
MDARYISRAIAIALISQLVLAVDQATAQYRTTNFLVMAPDSGFAKKVGDEAERFRRELSQLWLGHELPAWPQPCPITVRIEPNAGGETSFAFVPDQTGNSHPVDWRMTIFGSPERILDSVLPHEVTHTIFATHFGRPLPRWADEGACSTVEDASERERSHQMLIEFLTTGRGIPFNHMFAMKQYPSDILPLYSQGYSLARYLILQRGHRHFVDFVGEGMQREVPGREPQTWDEVSKKYYGYGDLSDLQVQWLGWVRKGCPEVDASAAPLALASSEATVPASPVNETPPLAGPAEVLEVATGLPASESWYVRQSRRGSSALVQRPGQGNSDAPPGAACLESRASIDSVGGSPTAPAVWR